VLSLYALTAFLAAALLFVVQPMVARLVLPLLGGAPAVWTTSLVFYQSALLAGYATAHAAARRLGPRGQALLYVTLVAAASLVLPVGVPWGWTPPDAASPIPWLLALLLVAVGPPFLVLSMSSPLLQSWFVTTGHRRAADPYVLFGASNLGSLAALVAYPAAIEPNLPLGAQSRLWAAAYGVLGLLALTCAVTVWRSASAVHAAAVPQADGLPAVRVAPERRARWVLLAAIPVSLMLSATTYLNTDIAAVPLLWVVPLALYLATLALAFAPWGAPARGLVAAAVPLAALPLALVLAAGGHEPLALVLPTHLGALFVLALASHAELARDRPPPGRLTEFYLWLAAGGAAGGLVNALVAPRLFASVTEYPLALVLACLMIGRPAAGPPRARALDLLLPVAVGLATAAVLAVGSRDSSAAGLVIGVAALICASFVRRPIRFALGLGAILLASTVYASPDGHVLHAERSFFGRHRVTLDPSRRYHLLFHGPTLHGMQSLDPGRRLEPLAYFHATGPVGQVLALAKESAATGPVGVVGLGAGTLACHGRPGQRWTFYEIDPVVERIARDPRYFTFLRECPPEVEVILGDARLSLTKAPAARYALVLLDAYSSDAPPVHLLTREALGLYLDKLAPGGLLAFNITNRHLDLAPVLARLARDLGLVALLRDDATVSEAERREGKLPSKWLVMARGPARLAPLAADPRWAAPAVGPDAPAWTDDYSALFHIFRWR